MSYPNVFREGIFGSQMPESGDVELVAHHEPRKYLTTVNFVLFLPPAPQPDFLSEITEAVVESATAGGISDPAEIAHLINEALAEFVALAPVEDFVATGPVNEDNTSREFVIKL